MMKKVTENSNKVFVAVLSMLSICYFLWICFRVPLVFHFDNYQEISFFVGFFLLGGYIFAIFLKVLGNPEVKVISKILFVITALLCVVSNIINLWPVIVLDTVSLNNNTYYLTGEPEIVDIHSFHYLYKCNSNSFLCERTSFYSGGGASFRSLYLMEENNEIHVIDTLFSDFPVLVYTYAKQPRFYSYPAELDSHFYYLAYYLDPEAIIPFTKRYMLFECNKENRDCVRLPFRYEKDGSYANVEAIEAIREIRVFIDTELDQETLVYTYTYGKNPQCYVEGCEILKE
jgi:hypothetical protein